MEIVYEINKNRKQIIFFVIQGELKGWIDKAIEMFPELKQEGTSINNGYLTKILSRVAQDVGERNNIHSWQSFKPNIVFCKTINKYGKISLLCKRKNRI